jgi:hypothetical protein
MTKPESSESGVPISLILCSIFYISLIIFFPIRAWTPELGINDVSEYLAGSTSPLFFLWLIYGYMMQRKELELQREVSKRSATDAGYQATIQRASLQPIFRSDKPARWTSELCSIDILISDSRLMINHKIDVDQVYKLFYKNSILEVDQQTGGEKLVITFDSKALKPAGMFKSEVFLDGHKLYVSYTDLTGFITRCTFGNTFREIPASESLSKRVLRGFHVTNIEYLRITE